jgi:nucleoside-diphosphate-sugar epimerase
MKRILVTGGAGFIGSHLCEKLIQEGHEVLFVVNFFTGSKSTIKHLPLPKSDPKQRQPDITQAKKALHWTPEVNLENGLIRTIAYFKSQI